jgi:Polyketide cyclase / dehydrase and lipid transport
MTNFSTVFPIKARPDRVLAVLRDVERWPEWTATMTTVQRLDTAPFAVGSKARVRQPKLPPAIWQVTELDDRGFTWITRSPGVLLTAGHLVEPADSGSKVTLSLRFSGFLAPLAARLYRKLIQQYLATEAEGLRKRSEAETSSRQ